MTANRIIGLEPYEPSTKTLQLFDQINAIFEREAEYLPLTLRQIFYRLVAANLIDKTEKAYKQLGNKLVRARRAGFIPFENMRDDGFVTPQSTGYENYDDWQTTMKRHAQYFTLDKQRDQPIRLLVWCEAGGMVQQLRQILASRGIPVCSSGGFDSLTTKHNMAKNLSELVEEGQTVRVLHIGDYDASGVCMFDSLKDDIFMLAVQKFKAVIEFERIALLPEQIEQYNLPTAPPKKTDKRSGFNDSKTTQCEAFAPSDFKVEVLKAVDKHIDDEILAAAHAEQIEAREKAVELLSNID